MKIRSIVARCGLTAIIAIVLSSAAVIFVLIPGSIYLSLPTCKTHVIYEGQRTIDAHGLAFECRPALWRLRNAGDIRIRVSIPEDVEVVMIDSFGKEYRNTARDGGGHEVAASFSSIPRWTRIKKMRITSAEPIECYKIYWNDWNPL
jgi:hypothetical protein